MESLPPSRRRTARMTFDLLLFLAAGALIAWMAHVGVSRGNETLISVASHGTSALIGAVTMYLKGV